MFKKKEKSPRTVNYLWVLAGGYLVYLGADLIYEVITGVASHQVISILAAIAFLLVGGAVCLREWRIYRYGTKEEQEAAAALAQAEAEAENDAEIPVTEEEPT